MSNRPAASNQDDEFGPGLPMRWAASRIATASILLILILGGIAYGIYSIVNNSSTTPTTSNKSNKTTSTSKPKTNSSPATTTPSTTPSTGSSVSPSTQLTNTGPGSVALVGFVTVSIAGTIGHYAWQKNLRRRGIASKEY